MIGTLELSIVTPGQVINRAGFLGLFFLEIVSPEHLANWLTITNGLSFEIFDPYNSFGTNFFGTKLLVK